MYTGMLWYDNDLRTALIVKVQKASSYYLKKYGRLPDICLVHPSMLDNKHPAVLQEQGKQITIRSYQPVLPDHFWIGTEDLTS